MTLIQYLQKSKGSELVVGGHRGHQSDVRENTIENFRQLNGLHVPYIEIDVQMTADWQIVIFHDAELEKTTPLQGTVHDFPLKELRTHFEINTVDEVLTWASDCEMGIAFELKLYPMYTLEERNMIARELAKAIQKHSYHENCFVFGKEYQTLREIRRQDDKINIAIIAPKNPSDAIPLMQGLNAFMYLDFLSGLNKQLVSDLHEAGYLVDGSVVDTEEDLKNALALGVDMIESNHPGYILTLL